MEKLLKSLVTKGPLGAENLGTVTEGVSKDIQMARNKLRGQANVMNLAKAENGLSHRVQHEGAGSTLILQIGQSSGVVYEKED